VPSGHTEREKALENRANLVTESMVSEEGSRNLDGDGWEETGDWNHEHSKDTAKREGKNRTEYVETKKKGRKRVK